MNKLEQELNFGELRFASPPRSAENQSEEN